MTASPYVLQADPKSFCPKGHPVDLLMHRAARYAAFYICWTCSRVFQVGRGEVRRNP